MIILVFIACLSVCCCESLDNVSQKQNQSVLIIGSSASALTAALLLTDRNVSVTILYATNEIENQISPITSTVNGVNYTLPRYHPAIYEHSTTVRQLAERFGNTFNTLDDLNLLVNGKEIMSISSNEWITTLLFSAVRHKCIRFLDIIGSNRIRNAIKNYNYDKYRQLYSNVSLADFAKNMGASSSFISCFFNSALINLGIQPENINAADAIERMQFYYLAGENGLKSYHMNNAYSSRNNSKLLISQILHQLRLKNTKFVSNYSIKALWVDPAQGKILGDLNNRNIKYDYVIVGDNLSRSKRLLETTKSYNSGAPNIYRPLSTVLASLSQYSASPVILSLKMWLVKSLNKERKPIIEVNNSPYPCSIQSIRQLEKISGSGNPGSILEVMISNKNASEPINWKKIVNELVGIFPELEHIGVDYYRIDPIDIGVVMDTRYGMNRLTTSSLVKLGISNLILAADWLDTENSKIACDIEKSVVIGYQAASRILGENDQISNFNSE